MVKFIKCPALPMAQATGISFLLLHFVNVRFATKQREAPVSHKALHICIFIEEQRLSYICCSGRSRKIWLVISSKAKNERSIPNGYLKRVAIFDGERNKF